MSRHAIRFVGGPIGRFFRSRGWAGVTLPIPWYGALVVIWLPPDRQWNVMELRHEVLGHVPQVDRMGTVRYLATILWQYAKHGHDNAPMEIEARRLAEAVHQREDSGE